MPDCPETPAMRDAVSTRIRRIRSIHATLTDWLPYGQRAVIEIAAAIADTNAEEVERAITDAPREPRSRT